MNKLTRRLLIVLLLTISGLLGLLFSLHQRQAEPEPAPIPITQTVHTPFTFVKQLAGDKDAGRKIFYEFCASCHGKQPLIDIQAPRIGDRKAWKVKKQLGISVLLDITINGVGAMPSRGGCFECSDSQLRETIQYMLNQSR